MEHMEHCPFFRNFPISKLSELKAPTKFWSPTGNFTLRSLVHPTNRKWVSSPPLWTDPSYPTSPTYNSLECKKKTRHNSWVARWDGGGPGKPINHHHFLLQRKAVLLMVSPFYHLVNIQKTMENHNFSLVNQLQIAILNSFLYVYQRVSPVAWNCHSDEVKSVHGFKPSLVAMLNCIGVKCPMLGVNLPKRGCMLQTPPM